MAKLICCDKCKSINIKEIEKEKRNCHITKESGFWGLGRSFQTDYIEHYSLYKKYKCNECSYEFEELDYSR